VSISPKGFVLTVAAIVSIPASLAAIIYLVGVAPSLKFAWMTRYAPYLYSCIGFALLMWTIWLVIDYVGIRRAALLKPVDLKPLIEAERQERTRAVHELRQSILDLNVTLRDHVAAVLPKSTQAQPLKQRTIDLSNDLFAFLKKQGPQPPEPFSLPASERNTIAKQKQAMNGYFDWQGSTYYHYMAFFRDRVLQIDYELAAMGVQTKLTRPEIDPLTKEVMENHKIDVQKIAETLLLTANQLPK